MLKRMIRRHDRKYWSEHAPAISDREYDSLVEELEALGKRYPALATADSPPRKVTGEEAGDFGDVVHKVGMLSLAKTYDAGELEEFDRTVRIALGKDTVGYVLEPKIDGLGVALYYEDGRFVRGATRGDGIRGKDITANLRTIRSVPARLRARSVLRTCEVRGEVYLPRKEFLRLNRRNRMRGEEPFSNPRNAAAGNVMRKDPGITAKTGLDIFVYTLSYHETGKFRTHWECLGAMKRAGLRVNGHITRHGGIREVLKQVGRWTRTRRRLGYDIDGLVVKVDDLSDQERLGSTSNHPRWAMAWKFPAVQDTTRLLCIEVRVGRTGALTPVAVLEPVELSGSTVSRATLHNERDIARKDIRLGDLVLVEKAGEVIPRIVKAVKAARTGREKKFRMPGRCPACGGRTGHIGGEVVSRCLNIGCPARIRYSIRHWGSSGAMDIDGLGPKVIDRLVDAGAVRSIADLYGLDGDRLASVEGLGKRSARNLLDEIEASKRRGLGAVLYGLGIRHAGRHAALLLSRRYPDIRGLMRAGPKELRSIQGLGEKVAGSVAGFFQNGKNRALVRELERRGVVLASGGGGREEPLAGKSFVFTGGLKDFTRDGAVNEVERRGATAASSVSARTDFVVVGADPGSKRDEARRLGIRILSEKEFKKLLGKGPSG